MREVPVAGPLVRLRSSLRRKVAAAAKHVRLPLPFSARVGLVRRLSSNLLLQAIGNLEGRDELYWLRTEGWAEAHRVLGLTPSRDRFVDTGWEFGLETEVKAALFRPLLASAYRERRDVRLAAWLDEFVTGRWLECMRSYLYGRERERRARSQAADIDRRMRGHVTRNADHPVLSPLSSALAGAGLSGRDRVGLIVTRPKPPQELHYIPVLERLRVLGISVVWLAVDPETHGGDVRARQHPWGLEVSLPVPGPEELTSTDPGVLSDYERLLERMEVGFRRLPLQRNLVASATCGLPTSVYRWLATSLVARHVFNLVSPRFVHTQVDKDLASRAFVVEARKRSVPSFFYYGAADVGAPQYWPFSDWILVANGARVEGLIKCLGVPEWRIEPVGELELDAVLREVRRVSQRRTHDSELRLTFLMKRPAETFFGPPAELFSLLRELVDGESPWICVLRPHPQDDYDYGWLEQALQGRIRLSGGKYGDSTGLAETLASVDLVVAVMGNAAYFAIATGKPVIVYNPDPKTNLGHDRLFACPDLPRHLRLVTDRDELVKLLRRVIAGEERELLSAEPLKPSFVRYLFHSLDGRTADRIALSLAANGATGLASQSMSERRG